MQRNFDARREQLSHFVEAYCLHKPINAIPELIARTGDASSRRYFDMQHLDNEASILNRLLAVDSPSENNTLAFIRIANFLSQNHVSVPKIEWADVQNGYMLVDKIHPAQLFYDALAEDNSQLENAINAAMLQLQQMQRPTQQPNWLEQYNEIEITAELSLFPEWFLTQLLGINISSPLATELNQLTQLLVDNFQQQPQTFVHRDYHCRNILVNTEHQQLTTIDFQDGVWGPATYDAVSLLRDCYIKYPESLIQTMLSQYYVNSDNIHFQSHSQQQWLRWFDLTGVQRHLKVLGIFARLCIRDSKPNYLFYIKHIIAMLCDVSQQYTELEMLNELLNQKVLPVVSSFNWYESTTEHYPLLIIN